MAASLASRLRLAAGDIKLAHSVFALPFAVLASFLARPETDSWGRFSGKLVLVVVCMVLARTWAMLVNRLADLRFDAANPRTARRAIASGRLSARDGAAIAAGAAALFVLAAAGFYLAFDNPWPAMLSLPVLAWIAFYSFTKRFTVLCHLFLGSALAASPIAAAIAVDPDSLARTPALWWLAAMVLLWVAGFDAIYALQDIDFDRSEGLSSLPARLGWRGGIWASRALHAGAVACLLVSARADPRLGPIYLAGALAACALLVVEHAILARRGKQGLDMAFFTVNGVVSCVLGLAGVADLWH